MTKYRGTPPNLEDELTPTNVTPELVEALAQPIGFIVLNWAMIEQALVCQIEAVGHLASDAGIAIKRQGAFSDRLTIMSKMLRELPQLSAYTASALALLDQAKGLQTLRDAVVHGTLQAFIPEEQGVIFNRMKPTSGKDGHNISQQLIKFESLQKAIIQVSEIRRRMDLLAESLMKSFGR